MPELPEVEVVKKSLINKTQNLIVKAVKINDGRLRYKIDRYKIKKIIGLKFKKISRRSKYLLFFFNKGIVMLVHLGMTGKFFFVNSKSKKYKTSFYYDINDENDKKHDRVIFDLSNNQKLIYNDIRKFGFIKFLKNINLEQSVHLKYLGPEPLSTKFNIEYFKNYIKGKERTIKDLLMDQKFIAGLGNIYVNEILFFGGVRPDRKIKNLKNFEIQKIIKFSKKIISKAIILGGSSIKDFSSSSGKKGSFQQHFSVYGKKEENCSKTKCDGKIKKIVIANRASFFCNKCQK
ncbi:MAG: bifunctional DNA-formamidopyrimidine glycosylase/DNA-(apurinic or apyrimidinic site) lyase [Candidatus Pelagibacter sp. TMED286]|nr:MAG: bifunctional DNA-formamidopyrimidine glycosylase/DNA-(apurinic or apyrimidinic site) lyase [Candidatus Pelagibacter sp. TMED286]